MLTLEEFEKIDKRCRGYCPVPRVIVVGGGGSYRVALLRRSYPLAQIYCFEPASQQRQEFQPFADTLSVEMVPMALGDKNGYQTLHLTAYGPCNSLFGSQPGAFELLQDEVGTETVPVIRLDDWCRRAEVDPKAIGCVYLDIQGAELLALKGAPLVLGHTRLVVLEVAFKPMYKDAPLAEDIDVYMRAAGFRRDLLIAAAMAPDVYGDAWYIRKEPAE